MLDRDRYIEEMVDGVRRAFAYMATSHPDLEVYSIAIWTDERAMMSAVSIDTWENSQLKCREANRMRAEINTKLRATGRQAALREMLRNTNPADFAFPKVAIVQNASLRRSAPEPDSWQLLDDALAEVQEIALREAAVLKLHRDAEIAVSS
jgi:hypothetical protein